MHQPTRMGFEPTHAEHNGLAVHRLNHSATSSSFASHLFKMPDSDHQLFSRALNELNWACQTRKVHKTFLVFVVFLPQNHPQKVLRSGVPWSCVKNHCGTHISTRMGFEPTRAEHNGLAVHRLNHSATSSSFALHLFKMPDSDHQLVSRALNELNWACQTRKMHLRCRAVGSPGPVFKTTILCTNRRGWDSNPRVQSTMD